LFGNTFIPSLGSAGYPRLLSPDRRPYKTQDGYICLAIYTDQHWQRFLERIDRRDLIEDPIFATFNSRLIYMKDITNILGGILCQNTSSYWLQFFDDLDIPASPLNSMENLSQDPHIDAVGLVRLQLHPTEGTIAVLRNPVIWNDTISEPAVAPKLGEHTEEMLCSLGICEDDIQAMIRDGVIAVHSTGSSDPAVRIPLSSATS